MRNLAEALRAASNLRCRPGPGSPPPRAPLTLGPSEDGNVVLTGRPRRTWIFPAPSMLSHTLWALEGRNHRPPLSFPLPDSLRPVRLAQPSSAAHPEMHRVWLLLRWGGDGKQCAAKEESPGSDR